MLPSWRERLVVGLSPAAVQFAQLGRGWRSRVVKRHNIACVEDGEGWRRPFTAAVEALPQQSTGAPLCELVLSNHFVRYQLVPWHDGVQGASERAALARAQFRAVHGDASDAWEIVVDAGDYGQPALACAVDRALLEQLQALSAAGAIRIAAIRPYLVRAFKRRQRELTGTAFWFVLLEAQRAWLVRVQDGAWASVSSRWLTTPSSDQLRASLAQEAALLPPDAADLPIYLVASTLDKAQARALHAAGLKVLPAVGVPLDLN